MALGIDTRVGTPLLLPTVGARRAWQPRVRKQARCSRGRVHAAPFARCSCGIYGAKDRRLLWRTRDPAVLGTVALWGTIIEHEYAYRGRFAYPQRLGLICPFCFWQQRRDSPVEHVARIPRHRLVPMCDRHFATARDTGYPIRGVLPLRKSSRRCWTRTRWTLSTEPSQPSSRARRTTLHVQVLPALLVGE